MLGGLALLVAPQEQTGKIQLGFVKIFRWPLSLGGNMALTASTEQTLGDTVPRREFNKLQIHVNNLEAMLRQQQEQFKKLSDLYNKYDVWEGADFALAEIITTNVKEARNELTIDCIGNARPAEGQFVIGDNSVIGRISDASAGTARVRLFTDPKSAIRVKIGDLDVPMMLKGNGDNSAKISLVKTEHKIKAGDYVFASGAGTAFLNTPLTIGKVARCVKNRKNPLEWDITVTPACNIEKLEDVNVIIMNPQK
jgi:rod shape-determining protein MreC